MTDAAEPRPERGVAPLPVRGGLVRLAVRRALPLRMLVLLLLVGALAAALDWGLPEAAHDPERAARMARGFLRQGIWTLLVLLVAPLVVHRAASTFREWREGDAEWLAPRPGGGGALLVSSFLGLWLTAAVLFALTAVLAEVAVGEAGPTHRLHQRVGSPSVVLFEGDAPVRWIQEDVSLAGLPAGTVVRLRPTVAPGSGPAVNVRVTATASTDPPGAPGRETRSRLFGRRAVEVDAPRSDAGALRLELARDGAGAVVVLPAGNVDILVPVASDRRVAWDLLGRLGLAAAAWIAVGLALGAWMRPALASLSVLALWVLPWWWGFGSAWIPGGDLPAVWSMLGEGLAPPVRGGGEWLAGAGALLFGIVGALPGLARGRWIG